MQIDLNKPLTDLDGTETGEKLNRVLADILKRSPSGDAIKILDWAIDLWKVGKITIDSSDFEVIRACVNQSQTWALAKAQILREMAAQKEAQKTA